MSERPHIIRRKKVVHGHHGGSWKIALADFMTAMMALFLVLWLISSSDEKALEEMAEYFSTPLLVAMTGGDKPTASTSAIPGGGDDPVHVDGERTRIDERRLHRPADVQKRLEDLRRRIQQLMDSDPELRDLRDQLRMFLVPEGLLVQLLDSERRPMFESGSDEVTSYMAILLRSLAPLFNEMPNLIAISGHTDSHPYRGGIQGYSNWELSTERANASRRELMAGGLQPDKLLRVEGMSDRVPLSGLNADDAMNRRIELIVLNEQATANILGRHGLLDELHLTPQQAEVQRTDHSGTEI